MELIASIVLVVGAVAAVGGGLYFDWHHKPDSHRTDRATKAAGGREPNTAGRLSSPHTS